MLPGDVKEPVGALLMVPGGWFADRDGFVGDSYTDADLLLLRIAQRIRGLGFVVGRYDNRGVTGNEFSIGICKDSVDPEGDTKHYLESCVDSEVRKSVTPEALAHDAATIYDYLSEQAAVEQNNIVVFAHSEGGMHVARLIGRQRINPKGILFAAATSLSPREVVRWQMVDRYVDEVMRWDHDRDGRVLPTDVQRYYGASLFPEVGVSQDDLCNDPSGWTESDAREFFAARYDEQKLATMQIPDQEPYPLSSETPFDFVAASHRWMKAFYTDDTPTISLLRSYSGLVAYHFGDLDRQVCTEREIKNIQSHKDSLPLHPRIFVHANRGHAFCTGKPVAGPMDTDAEDILVDEIVRMLTRADPALSCDQESP